MLLEDSVHYLLYSITLLNSFPLSCKNCSSTSCYVDMVKWLVTVLYFLKHTTKRSASEASNCYALHVEVTTAWYKERDSAVDHLGLKPGWISRQRSLGSSSKLKVALEDLHRRHQLETKWFVEETKLCVLVPVLVGIWESRLKQMPFVPGIWYLVTCHRLSCWTDDAVKTLLICMAVSIWSDRTATQTRSVF